MASVPLIIVHGYSDVGKSFERWRDLLDQRDVKSINICNWISLSNEITIKDVAEGFARALRAQNINGDFDALVHSTGMLVVRCWLADDPSRRGRLKHLVGIAPATFGSPLAARGRSVLGSIFKGNKDILSPDFLAAGDLILDGLELGSKFTWDLAHKDILGKEPYYGLDGSTPYVFVFCGTDAYGGLKRFVNSPGTDGTVRWAGTPLNCEKLIIDFRRGGAAPQGDDRFRSTNTPSKGGMPIPFWPVAGVNHATIVSNPPEFLLDAVNAALRVRTAEDFRTWQDTQTAMFVQERERLEQTRQAWQQFVVRTVDQLGDPVKDYHLQISGLDDQGNSIGEWEEGQFEMHAYAADKSFHCYHVNLADIDELIKNGQIQRLRIRVIASSGSAWVDYHGEGSQSLPAGAEVEVKDGRWDAILDIPLRKGDLQFFFPFTTTFIEMVLERDALPFGTGLAKIVTWEA